MHEVTEHSPGAPRRNVALAPGLGLIFDLDGVIVDSMPVHERAWERYVASLGLAGSDVAVRMHGRRNDEIIRDLLGPDTAPHVIEEHGSAKERLYREMLGSRLASHLVPGVAGWLDRVAGAPLALATNAERANVDFVLDGAKLRSHFQVIVDGSQVPCPKPAPDVYLRVAAELGMPPRNCIVFEDSPVGVAAVLAAGMRVVGILTHAGSLAGTLFSAANFRDPSLALWLSLQEAD
ncbi:MAG: HAD family hydrolase [Bryobacterales bacterium]|nr:HAD family hydrolase [Bryobacterales bacterium]